MNWVYRCVSMWRWKLCPRVTLYVGCPFAGKAWPHLDDMLEVGVGLAVEDWREGWIAGSLLVAGFGVGFSTGRNS